MGSLENLETSADISIVGHNYHTKCKPFFRHAAILIGKVNDQKKYYLKMW